MKTYIRADEFNKYKERMAGFGCTSCTDNVVPVDGMANIVPQSKNTPIKDTEDNIRERFDLNYEG